MTDIAISIGLDLSEAVKGRDQLLALNNSISTSLDGLVNKAKASSQGLGGAFSSSMTTGKKALDDYDKAAAAVMAGEARRSQQMAKAAQEQENAAKRLLSSYAPLAAESERLARDQETLNNLIAQGGPKVQQYQTALANLQQRQAFVANESGRMAAGAALSANQMRNLSYQINDVVSGLLMGQSPWQIFTQQAGQFAQIAQDANIKMTGLRWGVLGVGAAGVATFGAIGVHLYQLSTQLKTLTGQATAFNSAMTGGGAQSQAYGLATQGPFSRGELVTAMSELMRYRTLSAEVARSISRASVPMAEATGKSPDEVVRQLAEAAKGGYDGIMKLQDAYGMLTPEQVKHVRLLTEQGQQSEAARIAVEALQAQMSKAAAEVRGPITDAWIGFGNSYTKMLDSIVESPGFKRFEKMVDGLVRQAGVAMEVAAYINNKANAPATELRFEMPPAPGEAGAMPSPGGKDAATIRSEADTNKATELAEQYQKQIAAIRSLDATARMRAEVQQAADEKFRNIDNSEKQKAAYISGEMAKRQADAAREIAVIQFSVDAAQKQADTLQKLGRVEALKRAAQDQARTESFGRPTDVAARQRQILSGQEAQARGALAGQTIDYGIQVRGLEQITAAQTAGTRAMQEAERQVKVLAATEAYRNSALAAGVPVNDNLIKQYDDISRAELAAKQSAEAWAATMQGSANVAYRVQIQNLKDMEAKMREFGATAEEIAQMYEDAELRKLEASRNWADGAEGALRRYVNNAQNAGARAGQFVASGMRSAEDALVDFAMGTKTASQAFRDFASSVVRDLIRMQMQAAMAQAAGASGGGGGGLFGLLGSAFSMGVSYFSGGASGAEGYSGQYGGGSYEATTASTQSYYQDSSLNAFASGTDYAPPGMALVGENGPELMQMRGGERIYPNDQTRAILSPKATNDNSGGSGGGISFSVSVDARGSTDPAAVENAARRASEEVFAKHAPGLIERASNRALAKNGEMMMRGGRYARAVRGGNAS